jgi:hypothetical protein
MANEVSPEEGLPEIAFYYPGPIWYHSDWIKNLRTRDEITLTNWGP